MPVTFVGKREWGDLTSLGNQRWRIDELPDGVTEGTVAILHWRCEKSYTHPNTPGMGFLPVAGQLQSLVRTRLSLTEAPLGPGQIMYNYKGLGYIAGQPIITGFAAARILSLDSPIGVGVSIPGWTVRARACFTFWEGVEQIFWDGQSHVPGQILHPFGIHSGTVGIDAPHSCHWIHQWNQSGEHPDGWSMSQLVGPDDARYEVIVQDGLDGENPGPPVLIAECLDQEDPEVDWLHPHAVIAIGLCDVETDEEPPFEKPIKEVVQKDRRIHYPKWAYDGQLGQLDENYKTLERFCREGARSKCTLKVRHRPTAEEMTKNWHEIERWAWAYVREPGCLCVDNETSRIPTHPKCFLRVPHKEWATTTKDPRQEEENWLAVDRWMTTLANDHDCLCTEPEPDDGGGPVEG